MKEEGLEEGNGQGKTAVLALLAENKELLQRAPECLSKHIEIYENIHKDIDPNDHHHSSPHFRTIQDNSESFTKQLINASAEFVDIIANLKNNFIKLTDNLPASPSPSSSTSLSNFSIFVSEHTESTAL